MRGGEHARTSPSPRRRAPRRPLLRARARTRAAGDLPARPRAGARRRLRPDPTAEGRESRDADRLDRRARTVPVEPRRGARVVALEPGQGKCRLESEPEPARVARIRAKAVLRLVHVGSRLVDRDALDLTFQDHDFVAALEMDGDARIAQEV